MKASGGVLKRRDRSPWWRTERGGRPGERDIMCPACVASAAAMISSVLSTGGLTALVMAIFARRERRKEQL